MKRKCSQILHYKKSKIDNNDSDDGSDDGKHKHPEEDEYVFAIKNHIYFRTDVTLGSINKLDKLITKMNDKISKLNTVSDYGKFVPNPIYLHITSYGGDLMAGFMAVDSIKKSLTPIYTIVEGYACSCGSLMSVSGAKRYMTENAYILIHQLSGWTYGKYEELNDDKINNDLFMKKIKNIYQSASNNKLTKKQLDDVLRHDLFFDFDKSYKYGLVDEIYTV